MVISDLINDYPIFKAINNKRVICYAPFKSLNFEQNGNITVCCYNRTHVLGKYPESSILEIWNGNKIIGLRRAIKDLDFNHGCELCHYQLRSNNYSDFYGSQYDCFFQIEWKFLKF